MFTEIRALRFKSWRELPKLRLAPITGLFGSNSSGKTSILQLILMMQQTTESTDRSQPLNLGDDRDHVRLGSFIEVLFGHEPEPLEIGLTWRRESPLTVEDPDTQQGVLFSAASIQFETRLSLGRGGAPVVEYFQYKADENSVLMKRASGKDNYQLHATINGDGGYLKRARGRAWPLPPPHKCYGFPDQTFAYFQNASFVADLELELEQQFGRTYYLGPLRGYPNRQYTWSGTEPRDVGDAGARAIEAILASRFRGRTNFRKRNAIGRPTKKITVEQHVAEWLQQLGLVSSFTVEQIAEDADIYRVWVQRTPDATKVLLTDVGFGVSQVLPVLVLLAYVPSGSTVLLEQPEIHLHPAVQAGLADVIIEAAEVRGVQVLIESHSEHLLRRLQRRVSEAAASADSIVLYFCDADLGESRVRDLDLNLFGEIENWPKDFFGDPFGETAAIRKNILKRKAGLD
ncbi:MAG: DUF3696 domain-containing protein [Myxococcota bacterium]